MAYYHTCPSRGDNLAPGEYCDCQNKRKTAQGAAHTQSGKAKQKVSDTYCFASNYIEN